MMIAWDGNVFRVTGPLWGESTDYPWIPITKSQRCWPSIFLFDVCLNKELIKQSSWRWLETPWRLCDVTVMDEPIVLTNNLKIAKLPQLRPHLSIVAKKHSIATITQLRSLELLINSSTAYIILYKLIDTWFLDSNRRVGVWSLPWRWHILSIPLKTGRGTSAETCGLADVFPPDDLG